MVSAKDIKFQDANDHASHATTERAMLEDRLRLVEKKLLEVEANANSYKAVSERHKEIDEMKHELNRLKDLKVNHSELSFIEE